MRWRRVFLSNDPCFAVSGDGHYKGSPGIEHELVYIVETDQGQETMSPAEFAQRYGWKNDPAKVTMLPEVSKEQQAATSEAAKSSIQRKPAAAKP